MRKIITACLVLTLAINITNGQNITDSLLFYYDCNGNLYDLSVNGLFASTNANLSREEEGNYGFYYEMNGIDQSIEIPYSPFYLVEFPATLRMRFKVHSFPTGYNTILFTNDYTQFSYYGLEVVLTNSHKISVMYGNGGSLCPESRICKMINDTISSGEWYELVAIWENTEKLHIYLNCENKDGTYNGQSVDLAYSPFKRGAAIGVGDAQSSLNPTYFDGQVDEIAFWNRMLTQMEIVSFCKGNSLDINTSSAVDNFPYDIKVYPNPFSDHMTLAIDFKPREQIIFSLYTSKGELVRRLSVDSKKLIVKRNNLPTGVYYYHVTIKNTDKVGYGKLIIH